MLRKLYPSPVPFDMVTKVVKLSFTGASLHAGVLSWKNPESSVILVSRCELYYTTAATGACSVDVGATSTSATTASDNLIDGVDVNAAAPLAYSNAQGDATNQKPQMVLGIGGWVTVKEISGDATGLVATLYIHYHVV